MLNQEDIDMLFAEFSNRLAFSENEISISDSAMLKRARKKIFEFQKDRRNYYNTLAYEQSSEIPRRYYRMHDAWDSIRRITCYFFGVRLVRDIPYSQIERANDFACSLIDSYIESYLLMDKIDQAKGESI